jgi:hypothetical protein
VGEQLGRPVPEAMAAVEEAATKVNALIDGYVATGEVVVKIDVFQWAGVLTLHIPFPKG